MEGEWKYFRHFINEALKGHMSAADAFLPLLRHTLLKHTRKPKTKLIVFLCINLIECLK